MLIVQLNTCIDGFRILYFMLENALPYCLFAFVMMYQSLFLNYILALSYTVNRPYVQHST